MAGGLHRPVMGVALMCIAMVFLTGNDAMVKWLRSDYPVGQIIFIRSGVALVLMVMLAAASGRLARLRIRSWRQQVLRGLFSISGAFLFATALGLLPLADAIALTFAGPLFVGALAAPVLGEKVGWRRWSAILIGFIGILVIIRPGGTAWQWALLLPLAVAATDGARDLLTRHMALTEDSLSTMIFTFACLMAAALCTLPFGWQPVPSTAYLSFIGSGVFFAAAHFLMLEALRQAEAGLVVPYKYSSVVWAMLAGILVWGDWPDRWVLTGSAIIVASGLYVFHREGLKPNRSTERPHRAAER